MAMAPAVPQIIQSAAAVAEERVWAVAGLHCAACADTLRERLLQQSGVEEARVGYAAGIALVRAPATVQDGLTQALRGSGYRLAPLQPASSARLREQEARTLLWRLFVAGFCMMQVMMLAAPSYFEAGRAMPADLRQLLHWGSWVLSWPVMLFSSQPFMIGAWRGLRRRQLGMDLPVALAALVTFIVSSLVLFDPTGPWGSEVYFDSLTMFLAFLLAGRWFELKARHAAAAELALLVSESERPVQRELGDGSVLEAPLAELRAGDVVRVGLGEQIPVDGLLLEGETEVDEALLSGESRPVAKRAGETLVGGSLNLGRPIRLRALAAAHEGRAAQLAQRLQAALTDRPQGQALADRWASVFLAAVLLLAVAAGLFWAWWAPSQALAVVCAVLIVTCPCAFALAAPAARVASHRALARQGLLLQRLGALEVLARVDTVLLDKTGTLTRPVAAARPLHDGALTQLAAAVALASWSRHPLSQAIARLASAPAPRWREVQELPGRGLRGLDAQGRAWTLGAGEGGTVFGPEGEPAWLRFDIMDAPRPQAARVLQQLRELGLRIGLLSGDRAERVAAIAGQLDIVQFEGGCSPERKLDAVREAQAGGAVILMVGDGVNDAPVLAQADASLAVAGSAPLAAQAADVLLLRGGLEALPLLLRQARRTQAVMRQNLIWAAAYNGLAVPLALAGYLPPWAAGLGMALSSLLVVANAMRLQR
jgi:Cu2+-exporting ATPase